MHAREAQDLGTVPSNPCSIALGRRTLEVVTRLDSARRYFSVFCSAMAKRSLSPAPLPPAKRSHLSTPPPPTPARSCCFESLYDELILHIFTCLSYTDLCVAQSINRNWARLSLDNQVHSTFISRICSLLRDRVEHSGCLLVAVEEPLPARVWQAALEGFQGLRRP